MQLRLRNLITIIAQSTKEAGTSELAADYNLLQNIVVELKCKGEQSKYALGYIEEINHRGDTVFHVLYSEVDQLKVNDYYKVFSGVILYIAAAPELHNYKVKYYLVPDNYSKMLDNALKDYLM